MGGGRTGDLTSWRAYSVRGLIRTGIEGGLGGDELGGIAGASFDRPCSRIVDEMLGEGIGRLESRSIGGIGHRE